MAKKKGGSSTPWGGTTYHPDYSAAKTPEEAWNIYSQAINQHIDPHWQSQGVGHVYNPIGNYLGGHDSQVQKLAQLLGTTQRGSDIMNQVAAHHPNWSGAQQAQRVGQREQDVINKQLWGAGVRGISENNIIANLYNQLQHGKYKPGKAEAQTPEMQKKAFEQSPQYAAQQREEQFYYPQIQQKASQLIDAAEVMQRYFDTPSKFRTQFLNDLGYTSISDVTRGLDTYLQGEAITPENLRNAAAGLQSGPGRANYEIQDMLKQAAAGGKTQNALQAMMDWLAQQQGGKKQAKELIGLSPLQQMLLLSGAGAETGLKKKTTGSSSSTGPQTPVGL